MRFKGLRVYEGRMIIRKVPLAHIVWNEHNPNDKWEKGYVIHHIDANPLNDDISNLIKMTKAEHVKLHHTGRIMSEETRIKVCELRKLNPPMKGKHHSEETKKKLSDMKKGKIISDEVKEKISNSLKGRIPWNKGLKLNGGLC